MASYHTEIEDGEKVFVCDFCLTRHDDLSDAIDCCVPAAERAVYQEIPVQIVDDVVKWPAIELDVINAEYEAPAYIRELHEQLEDMKDTAMDIPASLRPTEPFFIEVDAERFKFRDSETHRAIREQIITTHIDQQTMILAPELVEQIIDNATFRQPVRLAAVVRPPDPECDRCGIAQRFGTVVFCACMLD